MKRRDLLAALPALPLAAIPVAGHATTPEHPNEKVRRLGREIMEALRDPRFIGFNRLTITPDFVGYAENDADTRIAYAVTEVQDALAEKYPGWRVQTINEAQRVIRSEGGVDYEGEVHRQAVLIFAGDESLYQQDARWHVNYPTT